MHFMIIWQFSECEGQSQKQQQHSKYGRLQEQNAVVTFQYYQMQDCHVSSVNVYPPASSGTLHCDAYQGARLQNSSVDSGWLAFWSIAPTNKGQPLAQSGPPLDLLKQTKEWYRPHPGFWHQSDLLFTASRNPPPYMQYKSFLPCS
jgi:hypothetical protein